jgi:hypothetical protein
MPAFGPLYCALTDFFTDARGTPIGAFRYQDDKIYKFVKNLTGADLVVGDVVFNGSNDLTLSEIYQLGQSAKGTAATLMAGVAISAIPAANFGWIQVFGRNASVNTLGHASNAVGVSLKGVSGQSYCTFDTAVATAATIAKHIVSLVAYTTTSAALKDGIIRCM